MTRQEYINEHYIRGKNWNKEEWQAEQRVLEKKHVENFVKSGQVSQQYLEKLEKCLVTQYWKSAKSSPHQYTLMKDFEDVDGIEFDDITAAIGKYGFFGYYWCDLQQYLIIGDFYYWSSLYPGAWELINRARIDTPPKEAYFSNFEGKWAVVGKPNIKSWPYPCNPYNGRRIDKNPFNGNPIREFKVNPENFGFTLNIDNARARERPIEHKKPSQLELF